VSGTDLVLAFDADCRRCRAIAATVARTCPELNVLPLTDYRVAAWRDEAGGFPWAPTLLAVTPGEHRDRVRAWQGPRLVAVLIGRIGPRRAWAVLRALRSAGLLRGVRRPSPGRDA
jgi:hypothetical protein